MGRIVTLDAEVVANGAGRAVLVFRGPTRQGYTWLVDLIQLSSTSANLPACALWRSATPGGQLIARNIDGRTGWFDGGAPSDRLVAGDAWSLEWTGCTAGATCRATLTATEDVPE